MTQICSRNAGSSCGLRDWRRIGRLVHRVSLCVSFDEASVRWAIQKNSFRQPLPACMPPSSVMAAINFFMDWPKGMRSQVWMAV